MDEGTYANVLKSYSHLGEVKYSRTHGGMYESVNPSHEKVGVRVIIQARLPFIVIRREEEFMRGRGMGQYR